MRTNSRKGGRRGKINIRTRYNTDIIDEEIIEVPINTCKPSATLADRACTWDDQISAGILAFGDLEALVQQAAVRTDIKVRTNTSRGFLGRTTYFHATGRYEDMLEFRDLLLSIG
jgi:hypothetical protein